MFLSEFKWLSSRYIYVHVFQVKISSGQMLKYDHIKSKKEEKKKKGFCKIN